MKKITENKIARVLGTVIGTAVILSFTVFMMLGVTLVVRKGLGVKDNPKECVDYTLREYREGNAPQKCQTEVYGDQF